MTRSTDDKNSMGINGLNVCTTETRSIVGMGDLEIIGLSLYCEAAIDKRSIVDNDSIRSTGLRISSLGETDSSLCCDGRP